MEGLLATLPAWAKLLLPIISPLLVAALKAVIPQVMDKLPSWSVPVVSAVLAALLGALGIDASAVGIVTAAAMGLAGSKVRDIAVGKPAAEDPALLGNS